MMDIIRISARQLVEFTLHGSDITPAGSLKAMHDGALGHRARQAALDDGWKAEVPLSLDIPVEDEDLVIRLGGRMDAFLDAEEPRLEEIKLWSGREQPEEAAPAHLFQARVYAWMLFADRNIARVHLAIVYVSRSGEVRGKFTESLNRQECRELFESILLPYLHYVRTIRKHVRARNASLLHLSFPFPSWRGGQRDMAVQVYTCISQKRRLLASMPTGTGKSMAVLFPALKALGQGLTGQLFYLTSRNTQREAPLEAVRLLGSQPLHLFCMVLQSKEHQCPEHLQCSPDLCPRAGGHFLRDNDALEEMLRLDDWSPEKIRSVCDQYCLCPFEFSLRLTEIADVVICDYNYAFDPAVHLQRIFDRVTNLTLLIDEAHHLPERIRDMLTGSVAGPDIRRLRQKTGQLHGRRHPLYKAMSGVLQALTGLPRDPDCAEQVIQSVPSSLLNRISALTDLISETPDPGLSPEDSELLRDVHSGLLSFQRAMEQDPEDYAFFLRGGKTPVLTALCLNPGSHFARLTARLSGTVAFSATMHPLSAMRRILCIDPEDALFEAPSPFPPEHLLVIRQNIDTRFSSRTATIPALVREIEALWASRPGRYIVFFPSFAYLRQVAEQLKVPAQVQTPGLTSEEREQFLLPYRSASEPVLSLCVLGGIFSESIDLPGSQLDGVVIVGTGLPQVCLENTLLREYLERTLGQGYYLACQVPGMQKIAQAAGRVIRTRDDRGVVLLLDDRYRLPVEASLCPPFWQIRTGDTRALLESFWGTGDVGSGK